MATRSGTAPQLAQLAPRAARQQAGQTRLSARGRVPRGAPGAPLPSRQALPSPPCSRLRSGARATGRSTLLPSETGLPPPQRPPAQPAARPGSRPPRRPPGTVTAWTRPAGTPRARRPRPLRSVPAAVTVPAAHARRPARVPGQRRGRVTSGRRRPERPPAAGGAGGGRFGRCRSSPLAGHAAAPAVSRPVPAAPQPQQRLLE